MSEYARVRTSGQWSADDGAEETVRVAGVECCATPDGAEWSGRRRRTPIAMFGRSERRPILSSADVQMPVHKAVPLALVEFFTGFEATALTDVSQALFALCFIPIRSVYWLLVSAGFWQDCLAELGSTAGVHSVPAVVAFFVANVGLTSLQLFWTTKILAGIRAKLAGDEIKKNS